MCFLFSVLLPFSFVALLFYGEACPNQDKFKCDLLMANPKKVLNPYRREVENYVPQKPFGSICLKCSACLAVARELDDIFKNLNTENNLKQNEIEKRIYEDIGDLCARGFHDYDLRTSDGIHSITNKLSCSKHVQTRMDGLWPNKMREICRTYLEFLDINFLLNEYLSKKQDIPSYLCKNSGIFRDCANLNIANQESGDIC